jgi:hypothetical protein
VGAQATLAALGAALAAVAVVLVVLALLALAGTALLVRRLRRPLLLVKGVSVPLRWRWSLARPAVLHRRLLVAVGQVRMALPAGRDGPWQDLAGDVERLAAGVDKELVELDRRARPLRQRGLPPLEARVREVEEVAGRLVAGLGTWEASGSGRSAGEIMERLQAIEGALAELQGPPGAPAIPPPGPATSPRDERRLPGAG